jgi:fructose-1,6-bisphosphatase/inositol monophosphatase family enzyme
VRAYDCRMLSDAFPEDGILGEEGARADSRSGRRWIIDPIDGTRDYVRGNPLWANLIALEAEGDVAGVVNLPVLGKLYARAVAAERIVNGSGIQASGKTSIDESVLCVNGYDKWPTRRFRDHLLDWMERFWAVRGLGGAADAMMVASGQAEVWIEPVASPWDFAPLKVILEEAGARYFNIDGGSHPSTRAMRLAARPDWSRKSGVSSGSLKKQAEARHGFFQYRVIGGVADSHRAFTAGSERNAGRQSHVVSSNSRLQKSNESETPAIRGTDRTRRRAWAR